MSAIGFTSRDRILHADDVSLVDLAARYPTPSYIYSGGKIRDTVTRLQAAMAAALPPGAQPLIAFACKANGNIGILRLMASLGLGADIVSGGEMTRALTAGVPANHVVFSGVGKTDAEISAALDAGILQINVESRPELERIAALAAAAGRIAPVSLRFNPDVDAGTHAKITTGKTENKFGLPRTEILELYAWAARQPALRMRGFSMHIGSQLTAVSPFEKAFTRMAELAEEARTCGLPLESLDIGGGLGVVYNEETPPDLDAYAALVRGIIHPLGVQIILEPGRLLVAEAGLLLSRVIYVKQGINRQYLILDAGMNDLMRPALYDAYHPIVPVVDTADAVVEYDVVGPICETGDTFAKARSLRPLQAGESHRDNGRGRLWRGHVVKLQYETTAARNSGRWRARGGDPSAADGGGYPGDGAVARLAGVMTPSDTHRHRRRLKRLRRLTHAVLFWEQALLRGWRALLWVGLFIVLWLWRVPALFGVSGGAATLAVFIGGLIFWIRQDLRRFASPSSDAVDRRLEAQSGLTHRPLAHLDDRLANPGRDRTHDLWGGGRQQAWETLRHLRRPRPQPQLARRDPAALRFLITILLALSFIYAGSSWPDYLRQGLWPFRSADTSIMAGNGVTLWITPPDYTHMPQRVLTRDGDPAQTITVPAGSVIKASVQDGFTRPVLKMGGQKLRFIRLGNSEERSWDIVTGALPGDMILIRQGLATRLRVPVTYHVDQPPRLRLKNSPVTLPNGGLQLDVAAADDYGVAGLGVQVQADPAVKDMPAAAAAEEWRSVATAPGMETDLSAVFDFTAHPWAGMPVLLTPEARDARGQLVRLPPLRVTLPERPFYNPVAQQLIALRKQLIAAPRAAAGNVAYDLETLLTQPAAFRGDLTVFLSIRSAASRLIWDNSVVAAPSVIAQLWNTALRVEDGNLSLSAGALEQAQAALARTLADPKAGAAQMTAAAEKLSAAMNEYLSQLYQGLQRRMAQTGLSPAQLTPEMFARKMNADVLNTLIDKLRAQAMAGNKDAASQLLSKLEQMTQAINPAAARMPPQLQAMFKNLNALNQLVQKQTDVQTRTRQAQKPVAAGDQEKIVQNLRNAQEALRGELDSLMQGGATGPGNFLKLIADAGNAMHEAADDLHAGKTIPAVKAQQQALDQLNRMREATRQQLQAMLRQMTLMTLGMGNTDPFGRPSGNGGTAQPAGDVKIPDEAQRRQIQEILNTLRQRSGELDRPDYEREYYERLLRDF